MPLVVTDAPKILTHRVLSFILNNVSNPVNAPCMGAFFLVAPPITLLRGVNASDSSPREQGGCQGAEGHAQCEGEMSVAIGSRNVLHLEWLGTFDQRRRRTLLGLLTSK